MGGASIKEITFASILSGVFTENEEYKKRGKGLFDASLKMLEAEIDAYVNKVTILKKISVTIEPSEINLKIDDETGKMTDFEESLEQSTFEIIYKVSNEEQQEELRQKLKKLLKDQIVFKNGVEKIILLLLLDETMPPECRLEYITDNEPAYISDLNRIRLPLEDELASCSALSHEIGHYLQKRLGLEQVFDSYQCSFARRLLIIAGTQTREKRRGVFYSKSVA